LWQGVKNRSYGNLGSFSRVGIQAGERHGVAVAPSCRFTADGNADCHAVFRTFQPQKSIGVNFQPWGCTCGFNCPISRIKCQK